MPITKCIFSQKYIKNFIPTNYILYIIIYLKIGDKYSLGLTFGQQKQKFFTLSCSCLSLKKHVKFSKDYKDIDDNLSQKAVLRISICNTFTSVIYKICQYYLNLIFSSSKVN